jgi:hypothetical protein
MGDEIIATTVLIAISARSINAAAQFCSSAYPIANMPISPEVGVGGTGGEVG